MIRAIIFDCFGVLAGDGWLPFKRKYFGHDPELFQQAGDLNKQVDAGLADYDDFIREVARLADITEVEAKLQIDDNPPDPDLFAYIKSVLKPKYKIGMLSNAGANWLPELFSPKQIKLFDAVTLSYETGIPKPDPRAYEIIAERLGVQPEECIFVDDQERYCVAAEGTGMRSIVFASFEQFRTELKSIIGAKA